MSSERNHRRFHLCLLLAAWGLLLPSLPGFAQCPPGYVKGSTTCVPWNICPDGTILIDRESCDEPSVSQPPSPPPPAPPPVELPPPPPPPPPRRPAVPPPPAVAEPVCESRFVAQGEGSPRRVLLVGGNLLELFERYRTEAAANGIEVDVKRLQVIYFSKGGSEEVILRWGNEVRLSLGEMVKGYLPERAWQRVLREKGAAAAVADAASNAARYNADLLCGRG